MSRLSSRRYILQILHFRLKVPGQHQALAVDAGAPAGKGACSPHEMHVWQELLWQVSAVAIRVLLLRCWCATSTG